MNLYVGYQGHDIDDEIDEDEEQELLIDEGGTVSPTMECNNEGVAAENNEDEEEDQEDKKNCVNGEELNNILDAEADDTIGSQALKELRKDFEKGDLGYNFYGHFYFKNFILS